MKILFVSMPYIHVIRWIENLKDTPHELYWFDVLDRGKFDTTDNVHQFTGWKKRKQRQIKGEYFFSKKFPVVYKWIQPFLEVTANEQLESVINEIQPDLIHSFEMQSCSYPILEVMNKFPRITWIYSCWGSDLFYYQNLSKDNKMIRQVLRRVDYLHTDCERDHEIARKLGFSGKHLEVIPGGTGYPLRQLEKYKLDLEKRTIILVKGYHHRFGRGLVVVQALQELQEKLKGFNIVVFGAHQEVIDFIDNNNLNFETYGRHGLNHDEIMKLMGQSLIYIGNSISDGMPNTLLEAIVMGAFPIQSNPGGVTAEIVTNGTNGFLIENPESVQEIKKQLLQVIHNTDLLKQAADLNRIIANNRLDYEVNKQKVVELYLKCQ
ncbi:MAG TPA: glycosyltransferase family 4 protein [Flavobacterium sp.]|uniref:glycosyltransferase family 4 protein n=1 Tax=Flavobacterium sp. TaxID=239 RepID=UPI002DBF1743|nr:glycosyltransferase family 4 protein [Flavobacterium sp.]HEU4790436.1 glycosyltransferase family 4 protein [Flavobacterium sp.]